MPNHALTSAVAADQASVDSPRRLRANALRMLAMDAVQQANSGHPGMPMGMADIAEVLWSDFLRHNPVNPHWPNRDRFIISNGHGSMLQYALLHLTGYDLPITQLAAFRQLHSQTPGHPEVGVTPGVETTTGPLGQGLANGVGMALAERRLAAEFNRPGLTLVDHYTYVLLGDGCLMEGISHEVCSLAGTQKLGKLILLYDDNGISIDGDVRGWFTDDTPKRFSAYGWQVLADVDGHNPKAVGEAIAAARAEGERPTLICCKTVIGYGAPNVAGSHECHGAPLGAAEVEATRAALQWPHPPFEIPAAVAAAWDARERGQGWEAAWRVTLADYRRRYPELAAEFERRLAGELPARWRDYADEVVAASAQQEAEMATRKASQQALERFGQLLPELMGGSADLTPSNNTARKSALDLTADSPQGDYLRYGVREFGMAAVMNGMALHGGLIPFGGTFLVFSDYARNAIRLSALMGQRVIYVLTHDSIGLGEDGPTHQPIEHLSSLRLIPQLELWRPSDAVETAVAWRCALENRQLPTCLVLSRQELPFVTRTTSQICAIAQGGYVVADPPAGVEPVALIIATGSELTLALQARTQLAEQGVAVRVVAMPCCERFERQSPLYRESVLPQRLRARVAVEAGRSTHWYRYVGLDGAVVGIDRFGESAPGKVVLAHFGFTVDHVVATTQQVLQRLTL